MIYEIIGKANKSKELKNLLLNVIPSLARYIQGLWKLDDKKFEE